MAKLRLAAVLAIAWVPVGVQSQFGGGGFGGYAPPAPKCKDFGGFSCKKDEKPVGKVDYQLWSYGCKESGMSFMNTASFDPSNPMKGMQQKNVDKCCVERDICKQTCGMSAVACHDGFQKCSKKICKGDQNCDMQAMLSEIMSDPVDEASPEKGSDPDESRCKGYNKAQRDSCHCVGKEEWQFETDSKLKAFYGKFNPEKLNNEGEIKDLDDVWKKWKGKEADMFMALATKYKDKAVEIRVKPKPPPYKPPAGGEDYGDESPDLKKAREGLQQEEDNLDGLTKERASKADTPTTVDLEGAMFETERAKIADKKRKAAEDEDYDLAQTLKEEVQGITKTEIERLKSLKNKAIEDEEYQAAKNLKARIAKLEL